MSRRDMPICRDCRKDCFARTKEGKCFCLEMTVFDENICPFYKPEGTVKHLVVARDYKEAKNKVSNII